MQTSCQGKCVSKKRVVKSNGLFSFLPGVVIALIPKCPFCILSFTSAITVCSTKGISEYTPHWTSYLSIVFALVTAIIVGYNFKGTKTLVSLVLILMGTSLILYSELFTGLIQPYYWGCIILVLGVWLNGSLLHFVYRVRSILFSLSKI